MKGCRVRVESKGMHALVQHMLLELGGRWAGRGGRVIEPMDKGILILSTDGIMFQGRHYENVVENHGWVRKLPEVTPQQLAKALQAKRAKEAAYERVRKYETYVVHRGS